MAKEKNKIKPIEKIDNKTFKMTEIFKFSPEERSAFYGALKKKFSAPISQVHEEILSWEYGEVVFTDGPLNYELRIQTELNELNRLRPHYNLSLIYHDGYFNEANAGAFLGVLNPFPDKQKTATISLDSIQFLIERETQTLHEKQASSPPLLEDEDTVMLRQQIEKIGLLNEEKAGSEFYPLLYTLRDAWHMIEKPWAQDNTKFAGKVAPILEIQAGTIARGLNRACNHLRKDIKSLACYPLSTLKAKEINIFGETEKMKELGEWQERLKKIKAVMS